MGPDQILDFILKGLEVVYGKPWIAPFILLPAMLLWAAALQIQAVRRTRPYLAAAKVRIDRLKASLGADSNPIRERSAFSDSIIDVTQALEAKSPGSETLVQAWREFQESIIDETSDPIRNTIRPSTYFLRAAPRQTTLVFWSNVFVGFGLILTFLGLVVALHTASNGMSGDLVQTKSALTTLLTVAGAKFFTSIAGIVASLWLRFAEHGLTKKVHAATETICALLERGMLYVPPQRLAAEQLQVLKEQRDELKTFNTDLALQIGERVGLQFQQAIAPVSDSLSQLNENISSMSEGLGQGAAKAVAEASGGELRALGQTLATLGERLDSLSSTVGSSGDDAARQIRAAGQDFATAAESIKAAFDQLVGQVDGMGGRLAEQGAEIAAAQGEALAKVVAGLDEAQRASRDAVTEAVQALQSASAAASQSLQKDLTDALTAGVSASQDVFARAVEASGDGLRSATSGLAKAVGDAAGQIERAGIGFQKSGEGAARAADALDGVAGHTRTVVTALADAAKGFATAAGPVAQASQSISDAAGRVSRAIEASRDADAEATKGLADLVEGVRATQDAAKGAWRDYQQRFEDVDKALEATTLKLGETLGDTFIEFRRFAQETDRELGAAVGKLSATLTAIEDYAEALSDHVEATHRASQREPAE